MFDARRIVDQINAGKLNDRYSLKELTQARDKVQKHNHKVIENIRTRKYQPIPDDRQIAHVFLNNSND